MKKVKFNDCFFVISSKNLFLADTYKDSVSYTWVIPMYVYAITSVFDGGEYFELSENPNNKEESIIQTTTYSHKSIDSKLFYSEKKAWKYFNEKFWPSQIAKFKRDRQIHLDHTKQK